MERRMDFNLEDGHSFGGRLHLPEDVTAGRAAVVVLAHGAANTMDHPLLGYLADELARAGFPALRFNFPYSEAGRPSPDPQTRLEAAWERVLEDLRADTDLAPRPIVAAGKSMGGRVASQMAAAGRLPVDGLIFYGYPLHPPGRKDRLRDAHLDAITLPMLFFAGSRDPFCDLDRMRPVCQRLGPSATLAVVEGGDHSFDLPPSQAQAQPEVYRRLLGQTVDWIRALDRAGAL